MSSMMKKHHINNSDICSDSDDDNVDVCRHPSRYSIGTDGSLSIRTATSTGTTTRNNGTSDPHDTTSAHESPRSTSSTILSSPTSSRSESSSSSSSRSRSRSRSLLKMLMIPKVWFKSSAKMTKKSEKKKSHIKQRTSVFYNGNGKGKGCTTNSTAELSMHDMPSFSSPPSKPSSSSSPPSSRDSTTDGSANVATTSEIVNKIEELIDIAVF